MAENPVPTLKEITAWMTGDSKLGVNYASTAKQATGEEDYNFLVKELQPKPSVSIGIHESAGIHKPEPRKPKKGEKPPATPAPVTVAQVAFWNEFGTYNKDGGVHIPARPFISSTMDENEKKYETFFGKLVEAIIRGKMTMPQALGVFGEKIQNDIKRKLTQIREPENAKSTLDAKFPKTNPLINSGQLRNSIRYIVGGGGNDSK